MVTTCAVKGCKSKAGQGIRFHRLPKGEIREAWITFIRKYNPLFMATSLSASVCGLHFLTDSDYEITPTSVYQTRVTRCLKKNAIPSIVHQNVSKPLFNKSNQELNCVPDEDAEEEVITLSLSDLKGLRDPPPAIAIPNVEYPTDNIVWQKPTLRNASTVSPAFILQTKNKIPSVLFTVQNASTVSPAPVIQNINKIPSALHTVQNASTVSPSTTIQYRNEIPNVPVQRTVEDTLLSPNNKRFFSMGDFKHISDIENPNSRLKYWIASQETVTTQQKKIKQLRKQTEAMKKKIKYLDNLVDQLKNEIKKKESNNCITVPMILSINLCEGFSRWEGLVWLFSVTISYLSSWKLTGIFWYLIDQMVGGRF